MRTILWFSFFWISLIFLTPQMLIAEHLNRNGRIHERDTLVHHVVRWWMNTLLRLAGVTVDVQGLENIPKGSAVFVANHQSNFDIPIMLCFLDKPHGIVAKAELGKIPFIRKWMVYLNCVFLERDNPRNSAAALNQAAENLRQGYSMVIFPEGTRSRGKEIGAFKHGAFKMAFKTQTPIVPVCIEGSYRAMESHGFWIHPAHVKVRIMPPVSTEQLAKEQLKALGQEIETLICKEHENILHEKVPAYSGF